MTGRGRRPLALVIGAALAAAVGCYAPDIGDGTLRCATDGVCPRGFSCGGDQHCWHTPDAGHADATGASAQGGIGGTPMGGGGANGGRGGAAGSGGVAGTGQGGSGGSGEGQGGTAGAAAGSGGTATAGEGGAMTTGRGGGPGGTGGGTGGGRGGGSGGESPPDAGHDASPRSLGAKCDTLADCSSGFCVDGVCCDGGCAGSCEACDVTPGRCAAVISGPPHGTRAACGGSGSCAGACTAASRATCTFPGTSSACGPPSCAGQTLTPAAFCDGRGSCTTPAASACAGGLACNAAGTACLTSCQHDADCVTPLPYCRASACTAARPAGITCSSDGDCQSGHCTDGLCCDLACTSQCQACDVSGHLGTCWPIPSDESPHGPRGACAGSGVCGSSCNGSAATCVFPGPETTCPCTVLSGTCNGAGQCTTVGGLCV